MSLLSSLLEYSGGLQPSSLLFCESPKEAITKEALEKRNLIREPQRQNYRPSKSLTKMSLYSSDPKIDPKERLLHRLAYKMEMKCRKHYYNFFVKLENISKKVAASNNKPKASPSPKLAAAIEKTSQVSAILFSKYFEREMKKLGFRQILKFGRYRTGFSMMFGRFCHMQKQQCFVKLYNFSKKIEKYQIRIQILASSIQTIINSAGNVGIKQVLRDSWKVIASYASRSCASKQTQQKQQKQLGKPTSASESLQQQSKARSVYQIYSALKSKANSRQNSPYKKAKTIELEVAPKGSKEGTFLKAYKVRTGLQERPFDFFERSSGVSQLCKKCQNDKLVSRQVNDIYDNNTLFFPFEIKGQEASPKMITQSSVQQVDFEDTFLSTYSKVTPPLSEVHQNSRVSTTSIKNGKNGTFGSDAVSFKNSLVYERESMKIQDLFSNLNQKKDDTLSKARNFIKQSRKVQEDWTQERESFSRIDSRYQSAEKSIFSSKIKNRRQSTGSLVPAYVQTMPFSLTINPHVQVAEHDYGKGYQTNRTSKAQSFTSCQKETSGRRPSFIKLTKKA